MQGRLSPPTTLWTARSTFRPAFTRPTRGTGPWAAPPMTTRTGATIIPRLADLDGDGRDEIVTESHGPRPERRQDHDPAQSTKRRHHAHNRGAEQHPAGC